MVLSELMDPLTIVEELPRRSTGLVYVNSIYICVCVCNEKGQSVEYSKKKKKKRL